MWRLGTGTPKGCGPEGYGTGGLGDPQDVERVVWEAQMMSHGLFGEPHVFCQRRCGTQRMRHGRLGGRKRCGTDCLGDPEDVARAVGDPTVVARAVWGTSTMWHGRFGRCNTFDSGGFSNPQIEARADLGSKCMWHDVVRDRTHVARLICERYGMWYGRHWCCTGVLWDLTDVARVSWAPEVFGTSCSKDMKDVARAACKTPRMWHARLGDPEDVVRGVEGSQRIGHERLRGSRSRGTGLVGDSTDVAAVSSGRQ